MIMNYILLEDNAPSQVLHGNTALQVHADDGQMDVDGAPGAVSAMQGDMDIDFPATLSAAGQDGESMEVDATTKAEPPGPMDVDILPRSPSCQPMEVDIKQNELVGRNTIPTNITARGVGPIYRQFTWKDKELPAWFVGFTERTGVTPALVVGGKRVSRRSEKKKAPAPPVSPPKPVVHKPLVHVRARVDIVTMASSSKVKLEDMPLPPATIVTNFHVPQNKAPTADPTDAKSSTQTATETPHRSRTTRLFSPLSPVRQSKIDDDFFLTSIRDAPDIVDGNRWLKTSRTPGRNIDNESVMFENDDADCSYLAVAYPPAEGDDVYPEINFAEAEASSEQPGIAPQATPYRRRMTRLFSPLSPVRQSKIDDDFFLTSIRDAPDIVDGNRWLKTSRTPGRNIDNESVMFENDADCSYLAVAYPPAEGDDVYPEINFAEAEASSEQPGIAPQATPYRHRMTRLFSPLSPVRQSKIDDDDDFFLTSNRQSPDLAINNRWLKTTRTPDRNIDNEPIVFEDDYADYSYLAIANPPVEDIDNFSLDDKVDNSVSQPEVATPRRIQNTKLFSPLSPVGHSVIDDDFFLTSNRQTPNLTAGNRWLKTSWTPGRNIDNESVTFEDEYVDLAVAYPAVDELESDSSIIESHASGYLADDSFSLSSEDSWASLASDNSFGYLGDISCSSLSDISEISTDDALSSYPSQSSISEALSSYPSQSSISEALSSYPSQSSISEALSSYPSQSSLSEVSEIAIVDDPSQVGLPTCTSTDLLIMRVRDLIASIDEVLGRSPTCTDNSAEGLETQHADDSELPLSHDFASVYETATFPESGSCEVMEAVVGEVDNDEEEGEESAKNEDFAEEDCQAAPLSLELSDEETNEEYYSLAPGSCLLSPGPGGVSPPAVFASQGSPLLDTQDIGTNISATNSDIFNVSGASRVLTDRLPVNDSPKAIGFFSSHLRGSIAQSYFVQDLALDELGREEVEAVQGIHRSQEDSHTGVLFTEESAAETRGDVNNGNEALSEPSWNLGSGSHYVSFPVERGDSSEELDVDELEDDLKYVYTLSF